jgi:IclR family KDG regulon transcriptional repressor
VGVPTSGRPSRGRAAAPFVTGAQSVVRALSILQTVTPSSPGVTPSGVALRFGYSIPTAYRLLRALESEGFLTLDRVAHEYYPGPEILRLSGVILDHDDLIPRLFSSLARLRDLTGESAALHWRHGNSRASVQELVSSHAVHVTVGVGRRYPLTRGAAGKALLSAAEEKDVEFLLSDPALVPPIAGRDSFRAELESARKLGFAASRGETITAAASVAAPVDWVHRGVAAISITGPAERFGPAQQAAASYALLDELDRLRQR